MFHVNPLLKIQALLSTKDKSKKIKCRLLHFLFGALRVKYIKRQDQTKLTLKCLSIGTPKAINFPFVSNEKFFRCPSIQAHCNEAVIYLNFGTPKNNEFSIWNKWKIYYF